jgi:hypothetical protein
MAQSFKNFWQKENISWLFFSLFFAVISFFFISLGIKSLAPWMFFGLKVIYLAYFSGWLFLLGFLFYLFGRKSISPDYLIRRLLLIFLPAELILLWGFFNASYFNTIPFYYLFKISTSLYPIIALFYFFFHYENYSRLRDFFYDFKENGGISKEAFFQKISSWFKRQGLATILILASVLILNFSFGFSRLGKFAAVDEPLWTSDTGRIQKFWNNVADGEFWKTMISDKPGITVAIISGAGLIQANPDLYTDYFLQKLPDKAPAVEKFNFTFRFPIFFFNLLMLVVIYIFAQKLLGKTVALISFIFIGLSPLLLGISLIVNPDSLIWTFFLLSLLSHFLYLENRANKYLFWSGIFLGFSILTKYVANILYIFYFLLIFLEYLVRKSRYEKEGLAQYLRKALGDYFVLLFLSLFTFYLFLPAAWVDIRRLLEGTILSKAFLPIWPVFAVVIAFILSDIVFWKNKITEKTMRWFSQFSQPLVKIVFALFLLFTLGMLINTYSGMRFYDLESIIASPKTSSTTNDFLGMMLANFYSLFFGITPLALLAIIGINLNNLFSKKEFTHKYVSSFYLTLFILIYYTASVFSGVSATIRYQIIIFPLAFILAGIGLANFIHFGPVRKYLPRRLAYLIIIFFSAYSLWSVKPFYFSYASDLLPQKYVLNLKDMGDGSFEAAQYLNTLPNAKNLSIWTDKRGVCSFFNGNCGSEMNSEKENSTFDYFVVSAGRKARTTKMTLSRFNGGHPSILRLDKIYEMTGADFYLKLGGRANNFVKIISAEKIIEN